MSLPPIPSDPVPTEAELQPFLAKVKWQPDVDAPASVKRGDIRRALARMEWERERQAEDPNAFLVPFSTYPQAFGSKAAYDAYRDGEIWKAQRKRVLEASGGKCVGCGSKATEVHHRDYRPRVLAGEDDAPLVALCRRCHQHVHEDDARGLEPSWQESEARLAELVARRDAPT